MCGRCRNVFNAFQSLTRVAEDEAVANISAASPAASRPMVAPVTAQPAAITGNAASPELTDAIFLREEPLPLSADFSQTDFASDVREREPLASYAPVSARALSPTNSLQLEDIDDETSFTEAATGAPAASGSLLPAYPEAAEETRGDNPLLAPNPAYRQPSAPSRKGLWITGTVILLLSLTAQLAYAYRSIVTQSWPQLRPAFASACEQIGCSLSWGRDESAIRIEASDLIELPGKTGRILLTATLVNRSMLRQDLPALELKLTDNANQVMLSRILQPADYLGRVPAKDESLAPNVEMYVNLSFEITQKAPASGYGVRAFYN